MVKHVLHAGRYIWFGGLGKIHIGLKTIGAKKTFTSGSDAGPLQRYGTVPTYKMVADLRDSNTTVRYLQDIVIPHYGTYLTDIIMQRYGTVRTYKIK